MINDESVLEEIYNMTLLKINYQIYNKIYSFSAHRRCVIWITPCKPDKLGNSLEKLHKVIDFEMFRNELETSLLNQDKKSNAGCKPYDVVMMFKIILLKRFYNLSDEQAEYQINDRLSFREFLGLSMGDKVPDARSIWLFQNNLIQKNLEGVLLE